MENRNCEIKELNLKLCAKRGLKPQLTQMQKLQLQLEKLQQEKAKWEQNKIYLNTKIEKHYEKNSEEYQHHLRMVSYRDEYLNKQEQKLLQKIEKQRVKDKTLTLEQQVEKLQQEEECWQKCKQNLLSELNKFYPQDIEDIHEGIKSMIENSYNKKITTKNIVFNNCLDSFKNIEKTFEQRKQELVNKMTPTQKWNWDWNNLQKEKEESKRSFAKQEESIKEHYEKNSSGGMYWRWLDDDRYYTEEYLRKKEEELRLRNPKLYGAKMKECEKLAKQKGKQEKVEQEKI